METNRWTLLDAFRTVSLAKADSQGTEASTPPQPQVRPQSQNLSRKTVLMLNIESTNESRAYSYSSLRCAALKSDSEMELHFDDARVTVCGSKLRDLYDRVITQVRERIGIDPPEPIDPDTVHVAEIRF